MKIQDIMTFVVTNYLYKNILHGLWLTLTLPAKPQSNSSIGSQGYERYRRQLVDQSTVTTKVSRSSAGQFTETHEK